MDLPQKKEIKHLKIYNLLSKIFKPKIICKIYGHNEDVDLWDWSGLVSYNYIQTCKRCGEQWILKERFRPH